MRFDLRLGAERGLRGGVGRPLLCSLPLFTVPTWRREVARSSVAARPIRAVLPVSGDACGGSLDGGGVEVDDCHVPSGHDMRRILFNWHLVVLHCLFYMTMLKFSLAHGTRPAGISKPNPARLYKARGESGMSIQRFLFYAHGFVFTTSQSVT